MDSCYQLNIAILVEFDTIGYSWLSKLLFKK